APRRQSNVPAAGRERRPVKYRNLPVRARPAAAAISVRELRPPSASAARNDAVIFDLDRDARMYRIAAVTAAAGVVARRHASDARVATIAAAAEDVAVVDDSDARTLRPVADPHCDRAGVVDQCCRT